MYFIIVKKKIMFMKKKHMSPNSLNNLRPNSSKWKNSDTKTVRLPKVLVEKIMKYAFILDHFYEADEKLYAISIEKLYIKLDEIYLSKKSLKIGINNFKKFLSHIVKESPTLF